MDDLYFKARIDCLLMARDSLGDTATPDAQIEYAQKLYERAIRSFEKAYTGGGVGSAGHVPPVVETYNS